MQLTGPVAKSPAMITKYSPDGSRTRGTVNNCANGYTPWGTYLTCEENWAGLLPARRPRPTTRRVPRRNSRRSRGTASPGTAASSGPRRPRRIATDTTFARWNAEKAGDVGGRQRRLPQRREHVRLGRRNRSLRHHVDPEEAHGARALRPRGRLDRPRGRRQTARLLHRATTRATSTSTNTYPTANWDPTDATRGLAAGDKYLDDGKLYVAKFNADGTGSGSSCVFGVERHRPPATLHTRSPTRPT